MIRVAYDVSFAVPQPGEPAVIYGRGTRYRRAVALFASQSGSGSSSRRRFWWGLESDDNEPRRKKWASRVLTPPIPA